MFLITSEYSTITKPWDLKYSSLEYNKPFSILDSGICDATVTSSQFETEVRSFECTTDGLVS